MELQQIYAMYFSATGTTKKVVTAIADRLSKLKHGIGATRIDFTLPERRSKVQSFHSGEVVVFGVPVYAGRVPNVLLKYIRTIQGGGALAVPVVSYGNRNFDDSLIELRDLLEDGGFHTVAGGAFIGEHAFSNTLAAGRPDEKDLAVAERFADGIFEKLEKIEGIEDSIAVEGKNPYRPYYVPKDRGGNPVNILKDRPKVNELCTDCGICAAVCPMGSIDSLDVREYVGICIKCGACVKKCPVQARYYDSYNYLYHKEELEVEFTRRAEPAIFL